MIVKVGAFSLIFVGVCGFVRPWLPMIETSGDVRPLQAFGPKNDASEPIAVSMKVPVGKDALKWNDGPIVITPNFDKSKSAVDVLLARAQERARNDADIISSRARSDIEFLQELDRAARTDVESTIARTTNLTLSNRLSLAWREVRAWCSWQIERNAKDDVRQVDLRTDISLRLNSASRIARGMPYAPPISTGSYTRLVRDDGNIAPQRPGPFPAKGSRPWRSELDPASARFLARASADAEEVLAAVNSHDGEEDADRFDWGNIYFDVEVGFTEESADRYGGNIYEGGYSEERGAASYEVTDETLEEYKELDFADIYSVDEDIVIGDECDLDESDPAFELVDTVIAGRWRRRRQEGGGDAKDEIYFDASPKRRC